MVRVEVPLEFLNSNLNDRPASVLFVPPVGFWVVFLADLFIDHLESIDPNPKCRHPFFDHADKSLMLNC